MTAFATTLPRQHPPSAPPGAVTVVGWLMALWCVGFAVVNIVFESTDHLADGQYADYAVAFTVMNWLVVVLKLLGAAVALLSVTKRPPPPPPRLLGVLTWAVFSTLTVYVLGGVVQAFGMALGLTGEASQINLASIAYLAFFLAAATGWGILAVTYTKRHTLGWSPAVLGTLAGPIVLGLVLVAIPALLRALHVMPT